MIVKNEEKMLQKTLPTLAKGVDEIILVDTGSTDNTIEVAKKYGAKVFHFPWINDFAAARNESLKHANGDWIIWIDADEFIKEEDWKKLRSFLGTAPQHAYMLRLLECKPGEFEGASFYFRAKVFKNREGIHFERAINEQLFTKEGKIVSGDLITGADIYHWGRMLDDDRMNKKHERNINMLKEAIKQNDNDKYYHFLLANNLKDMGLYQEAVIEYDKTIALDKEKSLAAKAHTYRGWCLYNLKQFKPAYLSGLEAMKIDKDEPGAYNLMGTVCLICGMIDQAEDFIKHAVGMEAPRDDTQRIFDVKQHKYQSNFLLGEVYLKKGDNSSAKQAFELARSFDATDEVVQKLEALR